MDEDAPEDDVDREGSAASQDSALPAPATARSQSSHGLQSGVNEKGPPRMAKPAEVGHDAVVNVVLSAQPIQSDTVPSDAKQRSFSLANQVQANMIISVWNMNHQKYFTLSFTSAAPSAPPSLPKQSRTVSTTPNRLSLSPRSDTGRPSLNGSGTCSPSGARSPLATATSPTSIPLSRAPFPLAGPPSHSDVVSTPSFLQKVTRLKDGMLNAMEIPVFAMWKDMSLAFPNRAGAWLSEKHTGPASGKTIGPFRSFKIYTEDFERELDPEEFPLVVLCKTQKPFSNWKIGLKSPETERHLRCVSSSCYQVCLTYFAQLRGQWGGYP
jgi:hypothetical protein